MPGDYGYIQKDHCIVTVYWGEVSLVDILETISRRIRDPELVEASASVIDLGPATWCEVSPKYVHDELTRLRPVFAPPKLPTLIVAPGDFFYGFGRMYALIQVIYGAARVEVVRSWKEAETALGRGLEGAEAWARERASEKTGERTVRVAPLR